MEEVRHIRTALGDLAVEIDPGRLPAREEVIPSLPTLAPPLSATVIEEREDRA